MRLTRSESVGKRRKDQKIRNKFKGKKKHKRLDAICEKAYNSSHRGVEKVESAEVNNGGNELELRRSSRTRRAPVLLDSSPMPPKKRRKIDKGVASSIEKVRRTDGVQCEIPCSSSRDLDGQSGWVSRLRSRAKSAIFSRRRKGESSLKGKRKLFEDSDGSGDEMEPESCDKKEGLVGEKSTVVKSKRPGRIKASNGLANENQEIDLGGRVEDGEEKNRDEVLEEMDEVDGLCLEVKLDCRTETGVEDCHIASDLAEREETAVQRDSDFEGCQSNDNVEARNESMEQEKMACDLESDQENVVKVDCATADQAKDEAHPDKPLEVETCKKLKGKYNALSDADNKPRIKLGRRCGLCGGGTDGKPPKILVLEGAGSDNEAYSGSSASEEPNYDVWDGFGDQSGWLGRLLGPINDRFGIAGIWVHQQCAVWSPEVYFAGLGCLKNVRAALYRGRVLKCSRCRRPGATIGCRVDRCPRTYHLPCARAKGCIFDHRKFLIACTDHRRLFQPHGIQNAQRLKKLKAKKLKLELRKMANDACRKDIEAEEKWLENCGEDEEFLKRESKRLQRDLWRIAPTYIGGENSEGERRFQGWESVAGLQDVIRCMKEVVILPLLYPEFFNNLGLTPPRGVLLHGYPGTGKTLVVRALVGSCARGDRKIAYFARKGADCLGKYVGDAERQLRLLFQVAEKSQPSIIFFDEIDGLAPCRSKQQDQTHNSVVSTLLALMDGLKSRGSVIVIGATNRPDAVDPALRRPGRFDREIYFPLPSLKDREAILSLHTQKWPKPISGSLLKWVAKHTVGFAGADLQALCTQAAIIALRRSFPLQKVLSAAETRAANSKCPAIPTFAVEERDWLKALSCAPPPCSRRESGIALNEVVTSPLKIHLVPCLLQPLTRLLVCLYLDERIWLPSHLNRASILVKNVIVSALDSRRVQSDKWWLHIDGLLQEVDVTNEIERNLLLANVLVEDSNPCGSNVIEENTDEDCSKYIHHKSQDMGARPGLLQNMYTGSCDKSGFQLLICGSPRSGQRHIASSLLHCFIGNIDVWKVDLASISHEGHGDMVHGLTRILMRCTGANSCMLYLPAIDLWAVETCDKASEDGCESSSMEPQSPGKTSSGGRWEVDMEDGLYPSADVTATQTQTEVKVASYLWNSFIEQVESMRANTSLIVLATSELPFSLLPNRIMQFFGNGILSCSLSRPLESQVPQFAVQLDAKFNHAKVITSFAAKLSQDFVQHFVQSLHGGNHIHENSVEEKARYTVEGDAARVCHNKSCHVGPSTPVGFTNKTLKGKPNLLLAISTFGYQILCYPHFAELCWVTSKLKEGPCANPNGPWKGWPFNSCIVRPMNSTEKVDTASSSSNIKIKGSGLVRGLVAVGLSAYRGKYTSLREVCSEVRKVLETLVGQIDDKIQAGKDRSQFVRLLSQVAYLEDMVISWAHALQSLEVDTRISEANTNNCIGSDNHVCKDSTTEGANGIVQGPEVLEKRPQEFGARDAGCSDPTDVDNGCADAANEVAVTIEEPSHQVVSIDCCSPEHTLAPNEVKLESSKAEAIGDHAEREHVSVKLCNGFPPSISDLQTGGPHGSGDKPVIKLCSATEISSPPNGPPSTVDNILSKDTGENSGANILHINNASEPSSLKGCPAATCFYQCCSECVVNLHNLLLRIINIEWDQKGTDSTVEDLHDFLSSLSANLILSLSKFLQCGNPSAIIREEGGDCRKYCDCRDFQRTDMPECKNADNFLITECGCHAATSKKSTSKEKLPGISRGLDLRFVFKDGVLATLDTGTDVSYHCKFKKLCLCFLIEWLVMSKKSFD
ncbi:Tat-binding7 [Sesamum alatum]|uniref:Tat-binding7 n=1 Tax=Sesamum alatum TaxID=300844 RepID=A0AAE1XZK5_9LAMI|nr:Tat-binding7 [Sesamum alatum]